MIAPSDIDRLKAELSPLEVAARYGLEPRRQGVDHVALCPFHSEKTPSFVIHREDVPGKPPFHCFGCGWSGDAIAFVMALEGIDFREACERLGCTEDESPADTEKRRQEQAERRKRQAEAIEQERQERAKQRERWPEFHEGKDSTLQELADLRNVSFTAVKLTQLSGALRFCMWKGHRCWAIGDFRTCAQVRKLDGELWPAVKDKPFKSQDLPGSKKRPIGLTRHPLPVLLVEGGPDLLAAWHWLHAGRQCSQYQPACMLGAQARLDSYASWLKGRDVWIAGHNDVGKTTGQNAARRWASEAIEAGAANVSLLNLPSGKDLNDLIS